jgi:DNA-binding NarL/FixJ family response regulator
MRHRVDKDSAVSDPTTVVLADDHHVVRQGLRALLEAEPGVSVVGEAADGASAIELTTRLVPDVLVVDLMMPGLDGFAVLRELRRQGTPTRVVVLSMHDSEAYVVEALKDGASAYVLKEGTASDFVHAIREAAGGRRYLSPPLSERAIDAYTRRAEGTSIAPHDALTTRELEVLRLAARGLSLQQIASELAISPRTAETHRAHLMRKLKLRSQTDVVRYAIRHGIVSASDG